jgi:hypothetical protein
MPRGPTTYRKRDLDIALRAARDAGLTVVRVEVDRDGRIIITTSAEPASSNSINENEWDVVLEKESK